MTETSELLEQARRAAAASYSPYSNFRVGAVVVTEDGTVFTGCNVENAAYGSSICAEANAIATAVGSGARTISTVAVTCLDGDDCYPCGNCLQLMREFGVDRIITDGGEYSLGDLLPHSFGPESLA
ncbi:MAG: cytidine deaminase [Acidimicrobiia bacterium]|nr:MAG: cytidine deaminase [Acidimicrobiia bacterium]